MLKLLAGFCWLLVGWLCVALLQLVLGIACVVDVFLRWLSQVFDWLLVMLLRVVEWSRY